MTGRLYLIPAPIAQGEIADVLPPFTCEKLLGIRHFLAENAKSARSYLSRFESHAPFAEIDIVEIGHRPDPRWVDSWLAPALAGEDMGVLSESGCPAVADPGAEVVRRAHELGLEVVPLVGPSSILMTVMASGLCGQRFRFVGYLPKGREEKAEALRELYRRSLADETQVFIETPYRNAQTLREALAALPEAALLTVALDITGPAQFIRTASVEDWRKRPPELPKAPAVFALKGEAELRARKRATGARRA